MKMNDGASTPTERYFLRAGAIAVLRYLSEVAYECGTADAILAISTLAQAHASPLPTAVAGAIQEVCQPPASSPVPPKSIG